MKKLQVEVADSPIKREYGLMDRKKLADNQGMLFKFQYSHYLNFWMRNTYIPLDIAFLDDNGRIIQIESMNPLSTRVTSAKQPCRYALEVNKDWFANNNISVGSMIVGEGLTHRKGKCVVAQGFMGHLKNIWDKLVKPKKPIDKVISKPEEKDKEEHKDTTEDDSQDPPEADVEGDYPTTMQTEPIPNQQNQQMESAPDQDISFLRDMRGKIRYANEHGLQMEILYWTMRGHMLPPRKVQPLEGEGYVVKNGPKGELLVAFDISPTINSGEGWSIKGMQPKSFLLDNIVNLALLDRNGNEIKPELIQQLRNQEKQQGQPNQPNQPNQLPIPQQPNSLIQ